MISLDRPLFILVGNGAYENRGCEAIVRGTTGIIREYFTDPQFICLSFFQSDKQYKNQCAKETDKDIHHLPTKMLTRKAKVCNFWKPEIWKNLLNWRFNQDNFYRSVYQEIYPYLTQATCVLSVGGDNYSLDYGVPTLFTALDDVIMERGIPMYIWGASVGPFSSNPKYEIYMGKHLKKIDGIFTRESLSANYLRSIGVIDNVYPSADPAFVMEPIKPKYFDESFEFEDGGIGLNFSPLMANFVTAGNLDGWVKYSTKILKEVVQKTESPIYLIPHVNRQDSNDYFFHQKILHEISGKKYKLSLISPEYNAAEIKWIISNLSFFIGTRTHATIAALSSNVPTISLGYSIKSQGINKDIFGHTKYCIYPSNGTPSLISSVFNSMIDEETDIVNYLKQRIPVIRQKALGAGVILKKKMCVRGL